jgi:hypothetical protein
MMMMGMACEFRIGDPLLDELIEHRVVEGEVIDLRRVLGQVGLAGRLRVPVPAAHARRVDHHEPLALGDTRVVGLVVHLQAAIRSTAVQCEDHRRGFALHRIGHEQEVLAGAAAGRDLPALEVLRGCQFAEAGKHGAPPLALALPNLAAELLPARGHGLEHGYARRLILFARIGQHVLDRDAGRRLFSVNVEPTSACDESQKHQPTHEP